MPETAIAMRPVMTPEQLKLIKETVAKNCTDHELQLFLHACQKTGLDPLMKQIYAVKRGGSMAIQTGIDGFRLIAERTGNYAPGREPSFAYDADGKIVAATAYIKKMTPDGTWHEVAATARFEEYCPGGQFWQKMPHVMIAKVAEALALRRAFPMELSGVYSTEEMTQADLEQVAAEKFKKLTPTAIGAVEQPVEEVPPCPPPPAVISAGRHRALEAAIDELEEAWGCAPDAFRERIKKKMAEDLGVEHFPDLSVDQYEQVMQWINQGWSRHRQGKPL
jgi:phage recombination protein Bet